MNNYMCTECEIIDELSNFIEPVKNGFYYTATCNKCHNRVCILKEHSDRYYDEFEISVAPEEDSWNKDKNDQM